MLNRPDEIQNVYKEALESSRAEGGTMTDQEEQLTTSRRLREALIKASAVGGVPKVHIYIDRDIVEVD